MSEFRLEARKLQFVLMRSTNLTKKVQNDLRDVWGPQDAMHSQLPPLIVFLFFIFFCFLLCVLWQIERIENHNLWKLYMVHRDTMLQDNQTGGKVERRLWHGTAKDALHNIQNAGFNKSFCGKNGM